VIAQTGFEVRTEGRGSYEITHSVIEAVRSTGVDCGLCHLFIHHTSASLMLCENADPDVLIDMETFMARVAPDGDPANRHNAEGPDDMPAHIRSVLTQTGLSIPIIAGRPGLGTWQGVYLWEHRHRGHQRRITITIQGERGAEAQ